MGGSLPLNRLLRYTYNSSSALLVACPALKNFNTGHRNWFYSALRGVTGLVSLKLKFKGKSFRWHRRRKALVLRFGHSHLVTCQPPRDTVWKRSGKTKMLFFNSNLALLREYLTSVVAWREPNRYHSRGLRLARQRIVRKAGKVSAYR
jgi:ribosomal protein L6P/L9E